MVALMYPKEDYIAKDVAMSISLNFDWVYEVPKWRRKETVVQKKLEKVKYAIFIAFDPRSELDRTTEKDIKFLLERGKKIFVIIPENYEFPYESQVERVERYRPRIEDYFKKIYDILGELAQKPTSPSDYFLLLLLAQILLFLFEKKLVKMIKRRLF
jgi:hypothetical protein